MTTDRRTFLLSSLLVSGAASKAAPQLTEAAQSVQRPIEVDSDVPYTVPDQPWPAVLGNHRARIPVASASHAVSAHVPWRRHDPNPEQKAVLVFGPGGTQVLNVSVAHVSEASADITFEAKAAGDYFVYYLPQVDPAAARTKGDRHEGHIETKGQYQAPQQTADQPWLAALSQRPPACPVAEFQSRTAFDSFYPMEVAATGDEIARLGQQHPQPYLLFPESRDYPIRMSRTLPARWIRSGPSNHVTADVLRGEFFVFQVGVYGQPLMGTAAVPLRVRFAPLNGPDGQSVPAVAFECFQAGGTDITGKAFTRNISVSSGHVTALWFGVQLPVELKPGAFHGNIELLIGAENSVETLPVELDFTVKKDFVRDGGVDQPRRMARLRWLNSKAGLEETITHPYTPLEVEDKTVRCLGRAVAFNDHCLPRSIEAGGLELLAAPVTLNVGENASRGESRVVSSTPARVVLESTNESGPYQLNIRTTIEFDGGIGFDVTLTGGRGGPVPNMVLEIPCRKEAVPYSVGMSLKGGMRPASWKWRWDEQPQRWKDQGSNLEYFVWLGSTKAGLFCRLKSPLESWKSGGVRIDEEGRDRVVFRAETGVRNIPAEEPVHLSFRLLPTPLKPLARDHWKLRYAHVYRPIDEVKASGATVLNIHHDTLPNLYINYPFLNLDLLTPYVREAQAAGLKAKIYYTVRELTTHLPEVWAFRALGDELYRTAGTQGHGASQLDFWLQEHLVDGYTPAWITRTPAGDIDAAIRTYFDSRLDNFYLEGLRWLLNNVPIDGLYLDEVGYPRGMMQRVRRVLETRPGAMIDLHGNHDWWSCNCPVGYYMEHLPYVDRLWFGEAFHPDSPPDFWLVEMSGIPFGLSSDMLQSPHVWRGMLFGMTHRAFYTGVSPQPLWKLWDEFGIEDAEMIGWWDAGSPVRTGRADVLATVYRKAGQSLVAIGSWSASAVEVSLSIDWKALGLNPSSQIAAPELDGLQSAQMFAADRPIPVPARKGALLIIKA